jgi:hypothetical protein
MHWSKGLFMSESSKRRLEHRYQLPDPLPVTILLRSLSRQGGRGVPGVLADASQNGMGIIVQERVALASRCEVEVVCKGEKQLFQGEVCYARRTDEGIRLGVMLDEANRPSILDYLSARGVSL